MWHCNLCSFWQIVRHGGCLGLGLAAMGTANQGWGAELLCLTSFLHLFSFLCAVSFFKSPLPFYLPTQSFLFSPPSTHIVLVELLCVLFSNATHLHCLCPYLPAEAYELLKENLYTRDDAVIGEAAGLAMGLVMLGTKSPAALEHMVNVSCTFCCLSSARSFHLLLIVLEGHAAREDSERPGSRHSNG